MLRIKWSDPLIPTNYTYIDIDRAGTNGDVVSWRCRVRTYLLGVLVLDSLAEWGFSSDYADYYDVAIGDIKFERETYDIYDCISVWWKPVYIAGLTDEDDDKIDWACVASPTITPGEYTGFLQGAGGDQAAPQRLLAQDAIV